MKVENVYNSDKFSLVSRQNCCLRAQVIRPFVWIHVIYILMLSWILGCKWNWGWISADESVSCLMITGFLVVMEV